MEILNKTLNKTLWDIILNNNIIARARKKGMRVFSKNYELTKYNNDYTVLFDSLIMARAIEIISSSVYGDDYNNGCCNESRDSEDEENCSYSDYYSEDYLVDVRFLLPSFEIIDFPFFVYDEEEYLKCEGSISVYATPSRLNDILSSVIRNDDRVVLLPELMTTKRFLIEILLINSEVSGCGEKVCIRIECSNCNDLFLCNVKLYGEYIAHEQFGYCCCGVVNDDPYDFKPTEDSPLIYDDYIIRLLYNTYCRNGKCVVAVVTKKLNYIKYPYYKYLPYYGFIDIISGEEDIKNAIERLKKRAIESIHEIMSSST